MIPYRVEVYHCLRMGSYSEYYFVMAGSEDEAIDKVMSEGDIKNDPRISRSDVEAIELSCTEVTYLWSNE